MKTTAVLIFVSYLVVSAECLERQNKCLVGGKHKESPSAEVSMFACKAYKEDSCCTSDFTKQLATSPIRKVGNFSWTPCNNALSSKCESFMVNVECFYRCSHNAIYWKNPQWPSAMSKAPICASFCDGWFDACKEDLTCAKNWITDFNMTSGINTCKEPCKKFSEYYTSGKDICEGMWDTTFIYEAETDCLQLNLTDPSPNDKLVEKLFGGKDNKAKNGALVFAVDLFMVSFPALLSVFLF